MEIVKISNVLLGKDRPLADLQAVELYSDQPEQLRLYYEYYIYNTILSRNLSSSVLGWMGFKRRLFFAISAFRAMSAIAPTSFCIPTITHILHCGKALIKHRKQVSIILPLAIIDSSKKC